MKGFGFRLWVAFVCLAASIAQAGNEKTRVTCGGLVSERAYATAPVGKAAIDRALENPRYADRIVKLLEAIVWISDQNKEVWDLIATGLRNGVYNPTPTSGVVMGIPTSLRLEKGREELLRVLEDQFTTPASYDTLEILAELLDRYPKVPYLPTTNVQTLGNVLSSLTLSGAKAFHEQQFNNFQHAFVTFASHHWVNFDSSTGHLQNKDEIARRLVRSKFIPAQYIQMLHTYMVKFLNVAIHDIWAAVLASECDMLVHINKHLPKFADDYLGRNQEKQTLLRNALIFSTIGERVVSGPTLRKEVISTFNTYLMELVKLAQAELPPPPRTTGVTTTTADTKPAATETKVTAVVTATETPTATAAPISSPEEDTNVATAAALRTPSANSSRPALSHRKVKRQQAAAQNGNSQTQTVENTRPSYPPLTDDMRAALIEGRASFQSDNNINFLYALKITERLLGSYRTSGSSHYVFHNPYSDRHIFNFQRHGNDLYPSNGRQLRHLIAQMIEIYEIDGE